MTLYTLDDALDAVTCCDNELHDGLDPVAKQNVAIVDGNRLRITFTPYGDDDATDESRAESFISGPFVRSEPKPQPTLEEQAAAVAAVRAKIAELDSPYLSIEDLGFTEVARQYGDKQRWGTRLVVVLRVGDVHVGVETTEPATENQEWPSPSQWDIFAVTPVEKTVTEWTEIKR